MAGFLTLLAGFCLAVCITGQAFAQEEDAPSSLLPKKVVAMDIYSCYSDIPLPRGYTAEEVAEWGVPYQAANLFYNQARDLYYDSQDAEALSALEQGLSVVDDFFDMEVWRIHLIDRVAGIDQMRLAVRAFNQRNEGSNWATLLYADALEFEGREIESLEQYRLAITIEPDDPWGYFRFGRLAEIQGLHDEAYEALSEAIRLRPGSYSYHCWRALSIYNLDPSASGAAAASREIGRGMAVDSSYREEYLDTMVGMGMVEGGVERIEEDPDHPEDAGQIIGPPAAPPMSHSEAPTSLAATQRGARWTAPLDPDSVTDEMLVKAIEKWFHEGLPRPMI